jgi:GNAT superfamily N-acetyltransferase
MTPSCPFLWDLPLTQHDPNPNLIFARATSADAEALSRVQKRAFDKLIADANRPTNETPYGYDSAEWQALMIDCCLYYKILSEGQLVGGLLIEDRGGGWYHILRIYIDPDFQRRGIGLQAMRFAEAELPHAKKWSLNTPIWSPGNQQFYEGLGYVKVSENRVGDLDLVIVNYEKTMTGNISQTRE